MTFILTDFTLFYADNTGAKLACCISITHFQSDLLEPKSKMLRLGLWRVFDGAVFRLAYVRVWSTAQAIEAAVSHKAAIESQQPNHP